MNIELSNHEIKALGQALSYAVVYAKTEVETAEFEMLKVKIEGEIVKYLERTNPLKLKKF